MKGVALIENSAEVKKASVQVRESDFQRELPSYMDILDFYN